MEILVKVKTAPQSPTLWRPHPIRPQGSTVSVLVQGTIGHYQNLTHILTHERKNLQEVTANYLIKVILDS